MTWLKKHWLLIVILILALILRLYRIDATMTFLEDEGRDLLIVKRMFDTGRPVLIGPQTSTGDMYLGPLYYYLIAPALYLSHMSPVGPAIMIAISGVITTGLLFYLGKKWFSTTAGYLAALMFGVLPFSVAVNRASWNPNLVPLITVLMLIVYDRLTIGEARRITWLFYGMLIGTMVQLHYMALIFCGVLSLAIAWSYRSRARILIKGTAISLIGAILVLAPFFVFELRNDWVNTHALIKFIAPAEGQNIRYDPPISLWWDKVGDTSYRLVSSTLVGSGADKQMTAVVVGLFVTVVLMTMRIKSVGHYSGLAYILLGCLAILGIYQENIHLHYLEFALPLIILLCAGVFQKSPGRLTKTCAALLVVLSFIWGVPRTLGAITSDPTHQADKAQAVAAYIVQASGGAPYNVVSTQGMYTTPFQYFVAVSPHPPSNTLTNQIFDICAGAPCPPDDASTTLLFLTGPAHPALQDYLGHPQLNSFATSRQIVSNEHVALGIWVAKIVLE